MNGVVHDYVLDGTRILADYSSGSELVFSYGENNTPQSFTYNGTKYNYVTNLQGDVMEIRDGTNNVVGSYVYNAYGQIISKSGAMADVNPIRYRGYYHDTETGFYYLNSRYYNPEIGRFINADSYASTGQGFIGYNVFAYCNNNPVNNIDYSGNEPITLTVSFLYLAAKLIVAAIAAYSAGKMAEIAITEYQRNAQSKSKSNTQPPPASMGGSSPASPSGPGGNNDNGNNQNKWNWQKVNEKYLESKLKEQGQIHIR